MNTQDAYEAIRAHFSAPGAVLAKEDAGYGKVCAYRTPEGAKCAVGCLIPDELYDPGMEGTTYCAVIRDFPRLGDYFAGVDTRFMERAQRLHDAHANDAFLFVELLDLLATASGLDVAKGTWSNL